VVAVSIMYLGFEFLKIPKRWSFLFAGLALGAYVLYLAVRRPHSWHDLGFRRDNLTAGLLPVGVCTAVVGAGLVAFALVKGRAVWQPTVLVLLALYPFWALAQQFAFQGVLHRGLKVLVQSPSLQVLLTAAAFASVHVGNPALFALTLLAGIMWSLLYRRWPNLWLLAGSHSILAALAYPLVLGDAPLSRL
jgi:membrane protease YdiL (CAAX protease family)